MKQTTIQVTKKEEKKKTHHEMEKDLTLEPFEHADQPAVKRALKEEKKYDIPDEFYNTLVVLDGRIRAKEQQIVRDTIGAVIDVEMNEYVPKLWVILTKSGVAKSSARNIIYGRLSRYRTIATIRKYIPVEGKDETNRNNAISGNKKQKEKRDAAENEAINKIAKQVDLSAEELKRRHDERSENGQKGGLKTRDSGQIAITGSFGGKGKKLEEDEQVQEQTHKVLSKLVEEGTIGLENLPSAQNTIITVELPEDSDAAKQIRDLWASEFHKAYLRVDIKGNIVAVDNLDSEANINNKKIEPEIKS
jgi:hypothetical protein